ncbi:MAG: Na+/H+ antiporter NhaC family protein [Clostridiales bacterium]|nr:Na+/H+ antiporter NhaC family protein [Clostridiales bacterium]
MKIKAKNIVTIVVVIAVLIMAIAVTASGAETTATFWALVPPIVAIALALITKEVYSSLFLGIVVGAIFASGGSVTAAVDHVVSDGFIAAISGTAGIFLFLVILGVIVALINKSGGSAAFGRWAETHIKSRIGAQLATFVLGILIFIDDYFNCLTVGSVMLPVTDSHRVSRAKLSYLIDATAAPICMIAPISSWAAAVSSYTEGTGLSGIELFVKAIPYNFYSLLTLVFVIAIVLLKADFGPMRRHEINAIEKGDLFSTTERVGGDDVESNPRGRVIDLVLPIVVLVVIAITGLLYVGGFFGVDIWGGTDCAGSFVGAFGNTDATVGLPWGSLIALVIIIAYLILRKLITFKDAMECVPKGFIAMVPAITILTLATSLKNMSNDLLGAAGYVEMLMTSDAAQQLSSFLPAVIFIVACILAFATGTSWGTFGILIPIVSSMFGPTNPLLYIGMSACLAGAVCGDHCSPISDTTIMSSAGARCVHVLHVSTQIPYAITVAVISFICYIVAGFVQNSIICLVLGAVLTVGFLLLMRAKNAKKAA